MLTSLGSMVITMYMREASTKKVKYGFVNFGFLSDIQIRLFSFNK